VAEQAEQAGESLSKGSRVVVVGRLQQRTWTGDDGSARSVVEVVADELGPSLTGAAALGNRSTAARPQERQRVGGSAGAIKEVRWFR
jgi:single-stranded DNA-binding protein